MWARAADGLFAVAALAVLAQLAVEGAGGDAEDGRGALAVAARLFEDAEDVLAFEVFEAAGLRVEGRVPGLGWRGLRRMKS